MTRLPAFLRRAPDPRAGLLAEALALYEDGLEIAAILALYPEEDRRWLRPLLATGRIVSDALGDEDASYYFEGSLKAKALEAADGGVIGGGGRARRALVPRALPGRTALAGAGALVAALALGVTGFGFVTAGDAVPGEWNYAFKRAAEGARARFASGDERINVNISQAQARIDEIQRLAVRGDLNRGHISRFTNELADLRELAEEESFDPLQRAKVRGLSESAVAVLTETDGELAPAAEEAIDRAHEVAAAVSGGAGVEPVATATPAATVAPAPTATAEPAPEPSTTPTPEPSPADAPESPVATATPEPDAPPVPDGGDGEVGLDADGATQPLEAPATATPEPPSAPSVTATPEPSPELPPTTPEPPPPPEADGAP